MDSLGKRIEHLRKTLNYTMQELADKCNISKSYVNDIEKGRVNPSLDTLTSIAKALDTTVSYLLGEDNNPADKITESLSDDPELARFWNDLKEREDLRLFFKQTRELSPSDIKKVMRIIKAIEDEEAASDDL